jgi:hypothetical protein
VHISAGPIAPIGTQWHVFYLPLFFKYIIGVLKKSFMQTKACATAADRHNETNGTTARLHSLAYLFCQHIRLRHSTDRGDLREMVYLVITSHILPDSTGTTSLNLKSGCRQGSMCWKIRPLPPPPHGTVLFWGKRKRGKCEKRKRNDKVIMESISMIAFLPKYTTLICTMYVCSDKAGKIAFLLIHTVNIYVHRVHIQYIYVLTARLIRLAGYLVFTVMFLLFLY